MVEVHTPTFYHDSFDKGDLLLDLEFNKKKQNIKRLICFIHIDYLFKTNYIWYLTVFMYEILTPDHCLCL